MLPGLLGVKGGEGAAISGREKPGAGRGVALDAGGCEWERSLWKARWRGEMKRDRAKPRLGGRHAGSTLPLGHEGVGIELD